MARKERVGPNASCRHVRQKNAMPITEAAISGLPVEYTERRIELV
jgi:hypothetical protein